MAASESIKTPSEEQHRPLVSPRDIANAIGASESSLRRWIDSGEIRISRTAGGHRRILLADAVAFIRKMGATVIRPQALGLGTLASDVGLPGQIDDDKLFNSLRAGDRDAARALINRKSVV